jgi:hypothetical protein
MKAAATATYLSMYQVCVEQSAAVSDNVSCGSALLCVAEADPKAYALLCFPGVRKQPTKLPKAAPEVGSEGQPAAV